MMPAKDPRTGKFLPRGSRAKTSARKSGTKRPRKSARKGLASTRGKRDVVAFLPLTKTNLLENQRRSVQAIAMLAHHLGHTQNAVRRIEDALISHNIMTSRYAPTALPPARKRKK